MNSQIFSKRAFEKFTREELDLYMDTFVEESSNVDIYDFKYRNNAVLNYNLEDKLSNIKAKTLVAISSDDIYYTPEFDAYPLKDKIENLEIYVFDAGDFVYNDDYLIFINLFLDFLEEFKKSSKSKKVKKKEENKISLNLFIHIFKSGF